MYRLTKAYIYRDRTVVIDKNVINDATDDDFRKVSLILSEENVKQLYSELKYLRDDYLPDESAAYGNDTELCELEQERNMYKSSSEVFYERLKKVWEERQKLIECLRFYERLARGREVNDGGRRARTILAEIGVTVE